MLSFLSRLVHTCPRTIPGVVALITAALGYHIQFLQVDFSIEQLFPGKEPDRQLYCDFRENFAQEDDLFLMVFRFVMLAGKPGSGAASDLGLGGLRGSGRGLFPQQQ